MDQPQKSRTGHLWGDRYKRVVVEPDSDALSAMACYIDMNPVRAGLVEDPKDYRWSGYGAAVGSDRAARAGLVRLYAADSTRALGSGQIEPSEQGVSVEQGEVPEQGRGPEWRDVAARQRDPIFVE